jgi:8-amino-7-oxononanoate synthase
MICRSDEFFPPGAAPIGRDALPGRVPTLEEYAKRRFMLAGGAILSEHNPYCAPTDALDRGQRALGRSLLSFAHYDYLGLGEDQRVRMAAAKAVLNFGVGVGASRLVGGERSIHAELEADLARLVGSEASLALVSGYGTNVALVGHLLTTGDLIIVDAFAHNSVLAGTRLSRAATRTFGHNDIDELAAILRAERCNFRRVLVVVEGIYSMDGDVPDLPRIVELCEAHDAWLMIDEAHSIGVLGGRGRGITEHFGIDPRRVDLIVGTLSKAFASCGGFICAKAPVIEWLRYTLPGHVYSVGLAPHVAAAVRAGLTVLEREPHRLRRLSETSRYFVTEAGRLGFQTGNAMGIGIVPIMFEDPEAALLASQALLAAGIYVPPIVQMGIPRDMPRLRFFVTANHTASDVDRVFEVLSSWRAHPGRVETEASRAQSPAAAHAEPPAIARVLG